MRGWRKVVYGGHGQRPGESALAKGSAADLVERTVRGLARFFREHGVEVTPWIALRADEAITAYAIAVELERELHNHGIFIIENGEEETEEMNPSRVRRVHPYVELAAKARERLRKALQELQSACEAGTGRTGTSWAEAIEAALATLPPVEGSPFIEFLATNDPKREAELLNQLTANGKKRAS